MSEAFQNNENYQHFHNFVTIRFDRVLVYYIKMYLLHWFFHLVKFHHKNECLHNVRDSKLTHQFFPPKIFLSWPFFLLHEDLSWIPLLLYLLQAWLVNTAWNNKLNKPYKTLLDYCMRETKLESTIHLQAIYTHFPTTIGWDHWATCT